MRTPNSHRSHSCKATDYAKFIYKFFISQHLQWAALIPEDLLSVLAFIENLPQDSQQGKVWNQNQAIEKAYLDLKSLHIFFLYVL